MGRRQGNGSHDTFCRCRDLGSGSQTLNCYSHLGSWISRVPGPHPQCDSVGQGSLPEIYFNLSSTSLL